MHVRLRGGCLQVIRAAWGGHLNFQIIDWESTGLKSDTGFLLCGGFKPLGKPAKVIGLKDTGLGETRTVIDSKLALALREEIEKQDGIIGWNSKMFDLPLLNDRLLHGGLDPVEKRFHIDIMYQARAGRSTFTSSRLDWVAKALGCPYRKTSLDMTTWKLAEAEALNGFKSGSDNYQYIVDHCKADLKVTEWVYNKLKNRVMNINKG